MNPENQGNFNRKISIIKLIREATNLGLKDSKEVTERLMAGESVDLPTLDIGKASELSSYGITINDKSVEFHELTKARNFTMRKTLDSITAGQFPEADSWFRMVEIVEQISSKLVNRG